MKTAKLDANQLGYLAQKAAEVALLHTRAASEARANAANTVMRSAAILSVPFLVAGLAFQELQSRQPEHAKAGSNSTYPSLGIVYKV